MNVEILNDAYNYNTFSFYDQGSNMWSTYTDQNGYVVVKYRTQAQTWAMGSSAIIKQVGGTPYFSSIAGYKNDGEGLPF